MSIIQNNKKISNVYINNKKISKIYYNNKLIYQSQPLYAQIVFRNIDENGNISLPQENINNYFDNITSIETRGLYYAFYNCSGLTGSISFPQLTSIGNDGLASAFDGCDGITELHFRADMQSIIESQSGYSDNFGATNATIYFDL